MPYYFIILKVKYRDDVFSWQIKALYKLKQYLHIFIQGNCIKIPTEAPEYTSERGDEQRSSNAALERRSKQKNNEGKDPDLMSLTWLLLWLITPHSDMLCTMARGPRINHLQNSGRLRSVGGFLQHPGALAPPP